MQDTSFQNKLNTLLESEDVVGKLESDPYSLGISLLNIHEELGIDVKYSYLDEILLFKNKSDILKYFVENANN